MFPLSVHYYKSIDVVHVVFHHTRFEWWFYLKKMSRQPEHKGHKFQHTRLPQARKDLRRIHLLPHSQQSNGLHSHHTHDTSANSEH